QEELQDLKMHFKKVCNTISRPHFLAERDGEEFLLNFSHDHKSLRSRRIGEQQDLLHLTEDEELACILAGRMPMRPRNNQLVDFYLDSYSKHGLGATDGKVYFFDDAIRTEQMKVWRIDSGSGENQFTSMNSGFVTRFSDSEYFIVTRGRGSHAAFIYEWRTNEDAKFIKKIQFPVNFADHNRIAFGRTILFVKTEQNKILITSIDAITEVVKKKVISLEDDIDPQKMRWFCAKTYVMAIIAGEFLLIHIESLTYEQMETNLDKSGKHHVFALDSEGFVYVLAPSHNGCSVLKARDIGLATIRDTPIVIPVKEEVKIPKKEKIEREKKEIEINFLVTYKGETLLNQKLKMLATNRIGDVIRRSPEIQLPPDTRLRTFYKNEEVLTNRTPNFLRMKDGDSIRGEFVDNENASDGSAVNDREGLNRRHNSGSSEPITGFFSPDVLNELGYGDANAVQNRDKQGKEEQQRKQNSGQDRPVPKPRNFQSDSSTPTPSHPDAIPAPRADPTATMEERLLNEMKWLRNFLNNDVNNGGELEQLKKKYARVLLMMGRMQTEK
ncbi:hypothetical protein PFISCL1PPCAC_27098, partial [Pristionchus fissidentatus]